MHPYWCLCKKRTNAQDIYTLGKALGGSRDRTGVAASQGTPSTARSHKKMEEAPDHILSARHWDYVRNEDR